MVIGHEVSRGEEGPGVWIHEAYIYGGGIMPLPLENTEGSILGREKVNIMWGAFVSHII